MTLTKDFVNNRCMTPILTALSGALLHFVWQGLLVSLALWVTLFALRSANARYAASCVALALLVAAPLATMYALYLPRPAVANVSTAQLPPVAIAQQPAAPLALPLAKWQSWVLPAWAFGVLVFSLRMVWGWAQVAALRRRGQPADAAVLSTIANLSHRLKLARPTQVLISTWPGGPSLVGWLRPVILLPASALAGLTPQQLEAVLAHELAHVLRHDYLVNWMQMLVETLLFYHPAVWWVSSRIRHERELCCDDLAVTACEGPVCYARALTNLEKLRTSTPAPALGSTGGLLLYRIQRIMGTTADSCGPSRASGIVALALALACVVLSVNWARGQSQDLMAQGNAAVRAGQYDQAIAAFQKMLERSDLEPHARGDLYFRIGESYRRKRDLASAIQALQTARTLIPDREAVMALVMALDAAGRQAEVAQLRESLQSALTTQAAMTTNFLKDELSAAEKNLQAAHSASQPDQLREARARLMELQQKLEASSAFREPLVGRVVTTVEVTGMPESAKAEILQQLPVRVGSVITEATLWTTATAVKMYDEGLALSIQPAPNGTAAIAIRRR
ncbi:Peptidase M56, BlaR1 (fragment) [Candidatus Sulfopaludibacter sp. SbA3]